MGWFKKKPDPISDRAHALSAEIAALEAQIKRLNAKGETGPPVPKLRSTAMPHGAAAAMHSSPPTPGPREPIFEDVDQKRLQAKAEAETTQEHYNDLGVRKYDLAAFVRRLKNHFRGP